MQKKTINKILSTVSILFFITGLVFITAYFYSTKKYNNSLTRNYLPPAGNFIEGNNNFSFAVMGDSGLRNEPFELIIKDITKNRNNSFILDVGDQARKLINSNFEYLLQINNKNIKDFPFYSVPGNHDVVYHGKGNEKQEDYLRFYNRAFGQAYYWFSYGNTLFIGLDTSKGAIYSAQEKWLKTTLKRLRSSFKSCIIFMHIPPVDPRQGQNYCMSKTESEKLYHIISEYNITAIIAGHIHEYLNSNFFNIPLYIVPPSGQKMRGTQKDFGYLQCRIDDGKLTVKNISVTKESGRDYLNQFISTDIQMLYTFETGILLIIASWILLFIICKINKFK